MGFNGAGPRGIIELSHAAGTVTATYHNVGGLVGYNSGTIRASYATADVKGDNYVGGLIGKSNTSFGAFHEVIVSYYYAGASVRQEGHPIRPLPEFARSAVQLAALSISDEYWNESVDVDGDPGTPDDIFDPWNFRTNYEYPVLRPYYDDDPSATWVDFGVQAHTPVVSFDAAMQLVEEPSDAAVVVPVSATMYNAPLADSISIVVQVDATSLADAIPEGDETMVFVLFDPTSAVSLSAQRKTTITIPANDYAVFFDNSGHVVDEGIGTVPISVSISHAPPEDIVIPIRIWSFAKVAWRQ